MLHYIEITSIRVTYNKKIASKLFLQIYCDTKKIRRIDICLIIRTVWEECCK